MTSYPPPPAYGMPPAPSGKQRYRGAMPRKLGWIFGAVGVVVLIIGIVVVATKSLGAVNDFERVSIAEAHGSVTFSHTGKYIAYYEAPGANRLTTVPMVRVALRGPDGNAQELQTPYGGRTDGRIRLLPYSYNGHQGVAMWQFSIATPGTYDVALQATPQTDPAGQVAFGKDIFSGTVAGGLLVVLGVLLLITAVILLIVGYVKRANHKKELASAQAYGGGYGAPPGYPAAGQYPGYGQPPASPYPPQQPGYQPGYQQPPGYQPPGYQPPQETPPQPSAPEQQSPWSTPPDDQQQG